MEQSSAGENAVVTAVFDDTYQAERAMAELSQLGLGEGSVDFTMTEASTLAGGDAVDEATPLGMETSQAIVKVRAGRHRDEVAGLLRRYGAFDVRMGEDDAGMASPGNVRDYGSSGERTVQRGATRSPYDAERDIPIDETTPPRIEDVNTYNVDIEGTGEVRTGESSGTPAPTDTQSDEGWEQVRSRYKSRWNQQYGTAGRRWEDYEPAYRFGWERSRMPDYQGRSWTEVEPKLRSNWEEGHNLSPWERIAGAVKDTWEHLTGSHEQEDVDRAA